MSFASDGNIVVKLPFTGIARADDGVHLKDGVVDLELAYRAIFVASMNTPSTVS